MLIGAPVIAYVSVNLPESRHDHGVPADWPAAALYLLAALGAARPIFAGRAKCLGGLDWALVAIAIVGCASTILRPESSLTLVVMTVLSVAAAIVWILGSRYSKSSYVAAVVFLSVALIGAWLWSPSDFMFYLLAQYVSLAMYWVNSSDDAISGH